MVVAATSKAKRIQTNLYGLSQKVRFVLLRFALLRTGVHLFTVIMVIHRVH